jgi:hypothetical protein
MPAPCQQPLTQGASSAKYGSTPRCAYYGLPSAEEPDRILEAFDEPVEVELRQLGQRLDREMVLVQRVVAARRGRQYVHGRWLPAG